MQECGICNGWEEMAYRCPACKGEMEDRGRITDFLNESRSNIVHTRTDTVREDKQSTDDCLHLFICSECGLEDIIGI
ncbi:hypothetical protein Q7A53_06695 [Halobacillus rhizosphaerae]|uniref:hypothetical protein n=1 Tax=Halobacillus rhizosphaerae TaxID=3064889 RepID=UPI00398AA56D